MVLPWNAPYHDSPISIFSGCPCNIECQSGCSECDHPVCQCADKKENDQWNRCIDTNGAILGRCFDDCEDDESCEAICTAEFKQNQKKCPCEVSKFELISKYG